MEALLSAFMAAVLAEMGDKTQWLALALGLHFGRFLPVISGIALAALANSAIAAVGGHYLGPMLTHEAATLLLALSLLFAGGGAFWPQKTHAPADRWTMGAFLSSFFAFFILELGDKTQFMNFAIATWSGSPILTAAGACAGIVVASAAAILIGRDFANILPVTGIRRGAGAVFLLIGTVTALGALGLI